MEFPLLGCISLKDSIALSQKTERGNGKRCSITNKNVFFIKNTINANVACPCACGWYLGWGVELYTITVIH